MPTQPTQFRDAKRETILMTFKSEYREKWYEMRDLQNRLYGHIQTLEVLFIFSLIFGTGGILLFLIKMIKDSDDTFFALCAIGAGVVCLICFFILKNKEKKDRPELRQRIRAFKRSVEIKAILKAFKEADVEWTIEDDAEFVDERT